MLLNSLLDPVGLLTPTLDPTIAAWEVIEADGSWENITRLGVSGSLVQAEDYVLVEAGKFLRDEAPRLGDVSTLRWFWIGGMSPSNSDNGSTLPAYRLEAWFDTTFYLRESVFCLAITPQKSII